MKPLVIAALSMLLPVAPLSASPSDTHKDDIMLPATSAMQDERPGPNYIDVMNQARKAMSDAQKRVDEQKAAAETSRSAVWTFEQALKEFKNGPGQAVTVAASDIESIAGRWVLSAYVDSQRNTTTATRGKIEFSHEGFRLPGDRSWRRYEGGVDAMMILEEDAVAGPAESREDFHLTSCSKPVAKNTMVCRTLTSRKPYGGAQPGSVTGYAKYTRVK